MPETWDRQPGESEAAPLPLALRHCEITEREAEAIFRNAKDMGLNVGRLRRTPRGVPLRDDPETL